MKTSVCRALCLALSSASLIAIAGTAHAQRQGAPIVYAGQDATQPPADVPNIERPAQVRVNGERRIEFRYPDQPGTVYSTPSAGIPATPSLPAAQTPTQLTLAGGPNTNVTTPSDPAITPGGFDARAAAADAASRAASAPSQPIRIASLQPQRAANTGMPLTLSRVSVNRDAAIGEERGQASVYVEGFDGQPTANGEIFDETAMTAAHPSLPLPSLVQVINESNSREVVVRVNDRGPFDGKRILELSPRAGEVLGISKGSTSDVRLRYLGPAPVKHNADQFASSPVAEESLPPVAPLAAPTAPIRVTSAGVAAPTYDSPVKITNLSVAGPVTVGNVFIQAGAFADIANAQRLTTSLRADLPVKIEEARVNGGDYFRVLIGPFPSMEDASVERDYLSRSAGVEGFLTKR